MSRSTSTAPGIAYQPALDGLRAIAVTMVLLFHGGVGWMRGGYFGVSIFFTLSGFLITTLLVTEFGSSGRIAITAFWARRARRLMPASLVCIGAISVLGAAGVWKGVGHLRRDALGALFQVANWVQLAAGESYTDLQRRDAGIVSPFDHFWSLSIEEQFYWVWPLAFWALARLARRRGWTMTAVVGSATAACAAAAPVIAVMWGRDAAYFATPARAAEILLGAWLAVALVEGRVRPHAWMAPVGAAVAIFLAIALPAAGGPAYHGAFPLLAVPTAVLLLGVQRPGPVVVALSTAPLVWLGRVSYGVYLYHFPVFLLMTRQRIGHDGIVLLAARVGATVAVAAVSARVLERPIRLRRATSRTTAVRSAIATVAICGLVVVLPAGGAGVYYAPDEALVDAAAIRPVATVGDTASTTAPATTTARAPSTSAAAPVASASVTEPTAPPVTTLVTTVASLGRPARILVVGDSTAEATGTGLVAWAVAHPELAQVSLAVESGCGFVRGGNVPSDDGVPFQALCDELLGELPDTLTALQPDVVVLMVTSRDIVPRQWNDEEGLLDPRDPRYLTRLKADYEAITQLILNTTGATIAWIRAPRIDGYWLGEPGPFTDPEMVQIREDVMRATIERHADRSELVDLRGWMEDTGLAFDHDARPDGVHFTPEASLAVAETWLGTQLLMTAAG